MSPSYLIDARLAHHVEVDDGAVLDVLGPRRVHERHLRLLVVLLCRAVPPSTSQQPDERPRSVSCLSHCSAR